MNQVVMSGIKDSCSGTTWKVYFTIGAGTLHGTGAGTSYFSGDEIMCTKVVNAGNWTGAVADARTMTIEANHSCTNNTHAGAVVFNTLSALDLENNVGFELG